MTTPHGDSRGQVERNGRNADAKPTLAPERASDSSEDEARRELLARVGVLRACLCELLRKNQELRFALISRGAEGIEDWVCNGKTRG